MPGPIFSPYDVFFFFLNLAIEMCVPMQTNCTLQLQQFPLLRLEMLESYLELELFFINLF